MCFWAAAFGLWFLLVGEWNRIEIVAAVCAATLTATFAERVRTVGLLPTRAPLRRLASLLGALAMVPVDFFLLMGVLLGGIARGRLPRGTFVERAYESGSDRTSRGMRAWDGFVANFSPNAYVVAFDGENGTVLLHDLVELRQSESPLG
jgi:hypothetical protein